MSNIPHPDKVEQGGEDAWLAHDSLLVVADGVGGTIRLGYSSDLYSKELVHQIKLLHEEDKMKQTRQLLFQGRAANDQMGSTTCVLAKLHETESDTL